MLATRAELVRYGGRFVSEPGLKQSKSFLVLFFKKELLPLAFAHSRALQRGTRAVVAVEFALVAPVLLALTLGAVDGARALLIWVEIHDAANAIAQAAEKLSVTIDPTTGAVTSELTADQMQQAMSVIYAEIPGLNLGNGGGLFPGQFAAVLTSITYSPLCSSAVSCGSQAAKMLWTSSLTVGGTQLFSNWVRPCTTPTQVASFPNNYVRMLDMTSPVLAGGQAMTLAPQIVADVRYNFTPYFPIYHGTTMMYATATLPAPVGGLNQTIALNTSAATGNVTTCN